MGKNVTLWGASYSSVPSLNVPQTGGGTASFFDVSDTTATASDVAQGKYFYLANGTKTQGTNQGGSGDGYVWQDQNGYVHLSDEQGTQPIVDSLTVSGSGTYTAPTGHVYNPVIVPSGTATPASSISGTSASVSTGTNTLTLSKTISNTPQVSGGYISSGTAGNTNVSLTASVNTRTSSDLSASTLTVTAPSGYYASNATKTLTDANLTAGNIKKDVSIFGVTGSYEGGGGGNWNWYGTNAENVKHYVVKRKLSETAFATWTPSTTSTNLETISSGSVTADFSNYSYSFVIRYNADFVYNTGVTLSVAPLKSFGLFYSDGYARYDSLSNYQTHTKSTTPAAITGISKSPLLYYNSSGDLTYVSSASYGVYLSGLGWSVNSANVSISTTVRARCSTTYFSTTMASALDQDASTYTVILDIYRIPINVDLMAGFEEELYGIYANGLPTT